MSGLSFHGSTKPSSRSWPHLALPCLALPWFHNFTICAPCSHENSDLTLSRALSLSLFLYLYIFIYLYIYLVLSLYSVFLSIYSVVFYLSLSFYLSFYLSSVPLWSTLPPYLSSWWWITVTWWHIGNNASSSLLSTGDPRWLAGKATPGGGWRPASAAGWRTLCWGRRGDMVGPLRVW